MTEMKEKNHKIFFSFEEGRRREHEVAEKSYGDGVSGRDAHSGKALCGVSVGYNDTADLVEECKMFEDQAFLDCVETIKTTAKSIVKFALDNEDVDVQVTLPAKDKQETPARGQAEFEQRPSSSGPPNWTPDYPEADKFLTTEGGFTRSKWKNSYARLDHDKTVYVNRSKSNDKWNMKDGQGNWWNGSWGHPWNGIMQELSELTGDK